MDKLHYSDHAVRVMNLNWGKKVSLLSLDKLVGHYVPKNKLVDGARNLLPRLNK